eukprot:7988968-Alexandrium_andersonii.AAC.1
MSASLVGSEMCIRDRSLARCHSARSLARPPADPKARPTPVHATCPAHARAWGLAYKASESNST